MKLCINTTDNQQLNMLKDGHLPAIQTFIILAKLVEIVPILFLNAYSPEEQKWIMKDIKDGFMRTAIIDLQVGPA